MFMSLFGISAGAQELPGDLELIAQDKTKGVYDFYAREDDKWKFFGNSRHAAATSAIGTVSVG